MSPSKQASKVVFVGQGPNHSAWERGVAFGQNVGATTEGPFDPIAFAERYCRRVAVTGAVGARLAGLIGLEVGEFSRRYARRNLNARFNGKSGKSGKGDEFDRAEALVAAARVLKEGFGRHVLLGAEVARAFGFKNAEPLTVKETFEPRRTFLIFPHPSGISQWWNEPFNVHRAGRRLREYLGIAEG